MRTVKMTTTRQAPARSQQYKVGIERGLRQHRTPQLAGDVFLLCGLPLACVPLHWLPSPQVQENVPENIPARTSSQLTKRIQ